MKTKNQIAIIGLGYVGLPLAIEFSKKYKVIGFDIDKNRINQINKGHDINKDINLSKITKRNNILFTNKKNFLKDCNIYIITVPTPIFANNKPNLTIIYNAIKIISKYLQNKNFVIFESTVFPGATEELFIPLIEKHTKLILNKTFYCGYSPERINPGDSKKTLINIKKITSGSNKYASNFINNLYKSIIKAGTHKVKNIKVAEAAKVIENAQRDLNIAFVNELSIIFNKLGIKTHDVLRAAETKWNFLKFQPGLVGGHCIGVDPYYLTYKAKSIGYEPKVILSGRKVNNHMPIFVFKEFIKNMKKNKIKIENSNILVMGATFKENCADIRNSKSIKIITLLKKNKMNVHVYDPIANKADLKKDYSITTIGQINKKKLYDAILVLVSHSVFQKIGIKKLISLTKKRSIIYDIKNTYKNENFYSL